jgi:3'(2'), 5'-bisphosphate nucleotidase
MSEKSLIPDFTFSELNACLLGLCRGAAHAISLVYDSPAALTVTSKQDKTPLTEADLVAHELILIGLLQNFPDIPVLSEESTDVSWEERQRWDRYWLVDPLDGTREFIERTGEFTINIALIEHGKPRYGMVFLPLENLAYAGADGVALKICGSSETIITARSTADQRSVTVLTSRRHRGEELDLCIAQLERRFERVERKYFGSALKFCYMAEGLADFYPRFSPCSEWDTAAGQAVLEAAGGTIVNLEFEPLTYNQRACLLNPHFYAFSDASFDWTELLKAPPS